MVSLDTVLLAASLYDITKQTKLDKIWHVRLALQHEL